MAKDAVYLILVLAVILVILFFNRHRKEGLYQGSLLAISAGLGWFLTAIARFFIHARRPFEVMGQPPLIPHSPGGSFPSEHSVLAFVLVAFIWKQNKSLGMISLILALLVGIGRIYVRIHYPIDIIGGALIGLGSFYLTAKFFRSKYFPFPAFQVKNH